MNLADHPLGDRVAGIQALGDELEGRAVVEQLARILRVGLGHGLALPDPLGLIQRQPGSFNVGGVMRFQDQRSVAHLPNPVGGELGRFEETPRPLDAGDRGGHPVGDGELGLEGGLHRVTDLP